MDLYWVINASLGSLQVRIGALIVREGKKEKESEYRMIAREREREWMRGNEEHESQNGVPK